MVIIIPSRWLPLIFISLMLVLLHLKDFVNYPFELWERIVTKNASCLWKALFPLQTSTVESTNSPSNLRFIAFDLTVTPGEISRNVPANIT